MNDGQKINIRADKWYRGPRVVAHRLDCDTPIIYLVDDEYTTALTDSDAKDLIVMLNRALKYLPSSK